MCACSHKALSRAGKGARNPRKQKVLQCWCESICRVVDAIDSTDQVKENFLKIILIRKKKSFFIYNLIKSSPAANALRFICFLMSFYVFFLFHRVLLPRLLINLLINQLFAKIVSIN